MDYQSIPEELKRLPQWVVWGVDAKKPKLPYNPITMKPSKAGQPTTWASFEQAVAAVECGQAKGIGFQFNDNGLYGIDLDHVLNLKTGQLTGEAQNIVSILDTYTEISPSGTGLHLLAYAKDLNLTKNRKGFIEIYNKGRFFTVTGNLYGELKPICECSNELKEIYDQYLIGPHKPKDNEPDWLQLGLERDSVLRNYWNGERPNGNESEDDLGFMSKLAYWLNRDTFKMIEAFLASPYTKQKDAEHQKKLEREDYLPRTAQKATESLTKTAKGDDRKYSSQQGGKKNQNSCKPPDYSDAGNAEVFAKIYKDELIYVDALGWLFWNGKHWERNEHCALLKMQDLSKLMLGEALDKYKSIIQDGLSRGENDNKKSSVEDRAYKYLTHAKKTREEPRIRRAIVLARGRLHHKIADLDANPFLLNTPAGMVNLKTGKISPHDANEFITKITEAPPGMENMQLWLDFLEVITCGDKDIERFLQQVIGMSAIGEVYHEGIIIAYGNGRNGKSTLFNAVNRVLGDYAGSIAVDIFTSEYINKGASLATVRGKRLIVTGELEENQRLSPSILKRLASTDKLVAEEKYKQPEEFRQSHTLIMFTNHLPRVSSTDCGTWRRITVVPFNASIRNEDCIPNYADYLVEKAGEAILSWIIEGAKLFCRNGFKLTMPGIIQNFTEEYREAEDWVTNFLMECTEEGDMVGSGALYEAYRLWAKAGGDRVRRSKDFSPALESAGLKKIRYNSRQYWQGIKIREKPEYSRCSAL